MTQNEAGAFDGLGKERSKSTSEQIKRAEAAKAKADDQLRDAVSKIETRTKVVEAIAILVETDQAITRQRIAQIANITLHVADDHLDRLHSEGKLRRVISGVYEPVLQFPATRPISHTVLPDGMSKTEVGDDMLTLTPKERRELGKLLMPDALAHNNIQATHDLNALTSEMVVCMLLLRRSCNFIDEVGAQLGIKPDPLTKGLDDRLKVLAERLMDSSYSQGV